MPNITVRKRSPLIKLYLLPPVLKFMLALLLFVMISLVGVMILKNQSTHELVQIKQKNELLEKEITAQSRTYGEMLYYSKNTKTTKQEYDALLKTFPPASRIGDLLSNITSLGTTEGLKFVSFRPKNEVVDKYYAFVPVDISVIGSFHQLAKFLSGIANLPESVVVVNQFTLEHSTDELLKLNLVASLYHTLPQSAEVKV